MRALIINCSPVRTGATAEIVKLVSEQLSNKYSVKSICIDDYVFAFCRGCRSCHNMSECEGYLNYEHWNDFLRITVTIFSSNNDLFCIQRFQKIISMYGKNIWQSSVGNI